MGVTGEADGGPVRIGVPIADYTTGLFALSGVLAALHARAEHPEGQHIKVAMLDAALNMQCNYIPSVAGLGAKIPRLGRGHAQIVPYQAFLCADGEYVMVGAFTRNFWINLCGALGRAEWTSDPRFATNSARLRNREVLTAEMATLFSSRPRAEWLDVLEAADVPCSPVLELNDAIRSEQVVHNGLLRDMRDGEMTATVVRSPIRVAEWGEPPCRMAPDLGRDTEAVLRDVLGLSEQAIARLAPSHDGTAPARGHSA
jgi:crotonobetainyl-CoA:carnitine CoA-transferase CaiB-like acyl-CoA transferase